MSVLARLLEAAGIATVVVTMMPTVAAALGAPRIVGVEFPFGHPFGIPHAPAVHDRVLAAALTTLAGASAPGTRIDIDVEWPHDVAEARREWQPTEPSPILAALVAEIRARREHPQR